MRCGATRVALCHYIPRAAFALAALGCNAQLKLDLVKAKTCPRMAGNLAIRNSAADTDNHGGLAGWKEMNR